MDHGGFSISSDGGNQVIPLLLFLLLGQAGPEPVKHEPKRVYMRAERFSFTPSQIKLQEGQPLELTIASEDTQHGFWIRKLGINYLIPARGKGELKLKIESLERGQYVFECSRACGAGHNMMRGVIKVK